MRLIDADALEKEGWSLHRTIRVDKNTEEYQTKPLKQIPTIEPERKRGVWQRRKGSDCWECSKCHAVLEDDDIARHNFYYCYHCGADMMNEYGYVKLEGVEQECGGNTTDTQK